MRDYIHDSFDYYAKTFIFIQSNGIGKSRLMDAFGKSCLIIKFILCKDDRYLSDNLEILQFMFLKPPDEVKESIIKLPQKKTAALDNSLIKTRKIIAL